MLAASDFDGTLSEIAVTPDAARPVEGAAAALAALARRPGWEVAIVSGRELRDLRSRCPVASAWYIGSHGNQLAAPRGRKLFLPQVRLHPAARAAALRLARRWPQVWVEAKPVSVAWHYRQAPELEAEIREQGHRLAARYGLRPLHGKCLLELIAPGARDKGGAVAALARRLRPDAILYFGDDRTDETVFALKLAPLLSVYLPPGRGEGRRRPRRGRHRWPTQAQYWLPGPQEVIQTLARLARDY